MKALEILVYGRVQGVSFRAMVKNYCDKKRINGYVVNMENGSVKIVACAEAGKLNEFVRWLKVSPGFSKVERVEKKEIEIKEEFGGFVIKKEGDFVSDQIQSFKNLGKKVLRG